MRKLAVLILIFVSSWSYSQEKELINPRVGLVLSGGGAKGLAHVGVLKTLDSLGVRVDYIAGTSMGAVVGALYASGYTGKQLDSIIKSTNFDLLISDKVPRNSKTFFERKNAEKYILTLPFNKFKIQLPSSISRGQNVFNLLSKLTLNVSGIDDFSKLPIPFYCIATDIQTGQEVVLDHGNLAQAIAASSALPTLFQPVKLNNKLLMDGGIVNNFPIERLLSKNLDFIIGVDVQDDLLQDDELNSVSNIMLQINNFRAVEELKEKSKLSDIYIKPDVGDFSIISFGQGAPIIEKGQKETLKFLKELQSISKAQNFKKTTLKFLKYNEISINKIKVFGLGKYTSSYVKGKLRFRNGETISYNDLGKGVNNLVATNNFDSFLYKLIPNGDRYDFNAELVEAKNTAFIRFGLHYDQLYNSAALLNLTKKQLLLKNDVVSVDFIFGDAPRYNFDYYIDKGFYWSIGINSKSNFINYKANPSFFSDNQQFSSTDKVEISISDFTNQFFIETLIKKDLSIKVGVELKNLTISSKDNFFNSLLSTDSYTFEDSNLFSLFGALKLDTLDDKFFPKNGILIEGNNQIFLSSPGSNSYFSQFSFLKLNIAKAFSIFDNGSLILGAQSGVKIGSTDIKSLDFGLGGYGYNNINNYFSFFGYDYFSLSGDSFTKVYATLDYEIFKDHHINVAANFANIGDNIFLNSEWVEVLNHSGYAVGYGIETIFGPVEIKYNWSPDTNYSAYLINVGYWF